MTHHRLNGHGLWSRDHFKILPFAMMQHVAWGLSATAGPWV